jgi:hypothetical protein
VFFVTRFKHIRISLTPLFSISIIWSAACTFTGRRQFGKRIQGDAMKARTVSRLAIATIAAMFLASQANAQDAVKRVIVVSLEDHKLALVEDGQVKKVYTVAVGKPSTPSPVGTFTIQRRVANPTYQHNGKIVPPGPRNPVGTRWMGLSKHGYGIHGTNEPNSIGKAASHGCIRMAKADLEELYPLVTEGNNESPSISAQPILLATSTTQAPAQEKDSDAASTANVNPPAAAVASIVASR